MTAANTSALSYLYAALTADLASSSTAVHFGRREPARQIGQGFTTCNRVVIDPSSGSNAGKFGPAKYPQRNPKPVAAFIAAATVYVWAIDPTDPNNELLQYEAVTALQAKVVASIWRALHTKTVTSRALHGWFEMSDPQWVGDKIERSRGAEWAFTLSVQEDVLDVPDASITGTPGTIIYDLTSTAGT